MHAVTCDTVLDYLLDFKQHCTFNKHLNIDEDTDI